LDAAIARGAFATRAAAVRAGLDYLLREEREAEISAAYRRGYASEKDDDAVGAVGLELGSALLAGENLADREPTA
jgi:Arc/MetJ-type ribon-helix-helix transcriptional regulator